MKDTLNRDNSNDSRYWGPVPESHLIGKAFLIWMHLNQDSSCLLYTSDAADE